VPAREAIKYERKIFELDHVYKNDFKTPNPHKPTDFNGPPRKALDDAWEDLTQCNSSFFFLPQYPTKLTKNTTDTNLRFTREELGEHANEKSLVALPDGGYFGTLTVYHSLHCVRELHHYVWKEHYFPNLGETETLRLRAHAEHCIDTLRQNIQCKADVTVQAFHWGEK
jgi:hypothetical protein